MVGPWQKLFCCVSAAEVLLAECLVWVSRWWKVYGDWCWQTLCAEMGTFLTSYQIKLLGTRTKTDPWVISKVFH